MTTALTRRHLLSAALATGIAVPFADAGRGWATPPSPVSGPPRLTLPPPTGPHSVGTVSLHLVDRSRPDPVAGPGHHRELMASVWYPATRDARRYPVAPWMTVALTRARLTAMGLNADALAAPHTAGHEQAPVLRSLGRVPVVVYSHGSDGHRAEATIVVQELASHGYVVVTVAHTGDTYAEFPDGRLIVPTAESFTPWDYADDIRSVLDRIEDLAAGRNPDAGRRALPAGLGAALDLRRVGMFGFSKGATATALVMNTDRRVHAGLSLDGPMESNPRATDIDRPFMLMTAENHRDPQSSEPSESPVEEFWSRLRGWRLNVHAARAAHLSYCDSQWLFPQLATITGMSAEDLARSIGPLDPRLAVRIQQVYPRAFFDQHLRHQRQRLLQCPNPAFGAALTYIP